MPEQDFTSLRLQRPPVRMNEIHISLYSNSLRHFFRPALSEHTSNRCEPHREHVVGKGTRIPLHECVITPMRHNPFCRASPSFDILSSFVIRISSFFQSPRPKIGGAAAPPPLTLQHDYHIATGGRNAAGVSQKRCRLQRAVLSRRAHHRNLLSP